MPFLLFLFWSLVPGPWSLVHSLPKDPNYPLPKALLTDKTLAYLHRYYYAPERIKPDAMFEAALFSIQRAIPEVLAKCHPGQFCSVTVNQAVKRFPYPGGSLKELDSRLQEIFEFMDRHVDVETEKHDIEYAAIIGMLDAMDPHSNFMSPEVYREFRVGTEGEFGGLGIVISLKDGKLTVTAPLEGTPAWEAGLKPGDHIVQIGEESTINMDLTEAVARLRGRPGSQVTLKVEREEKEGKKKIFSAVLTRAIISIEAVQSQLVQTPGKRAVGFLRIKSFQSNTQREVQDHMRKMGQQNPSLAGLVLDLRNNPGGLLDQAVLMADIFLKAGTIVSTRGRGRSLMDRKTAKADGFEPDFPLIVLVNEASASASEIVAGALKNNDRALVVGTTTFGKGTVQSIYELPLEAAIKITVGQYYTPGDQSIQSVGIPPDIELIPVRVDKEKLDAIENILMFEKDLEKHLDREAAVVEKPKFRLRFLAEALEEEEEAKEYRTQLDLKGDTAALLAIEMMDRFTSGLRPAMLKEAGGFLAQKQKTEQKKIAGEFAKLGVNWEEGKPKGNPQAELSYDLLKNGKKVSQARAGEEITLRIQIKNVGDGPFRKLAAQTDSKIYNFKNLEFAFGQVAPQTTRVWEHPLKIPLASPTEEEVLNLSFEESHGRAPLPVEILLPIEELAPPHFAHQFFLGRENFAKLAEGKTVPFDVEVANTGEGPSLQPVVAIKNLGSKEVFIEKGREVLKELRPGKKETAHFRFHIDPSAKPSQLRFELSITDADLFVRSEQEIVLRLQEKSVEPAAGQWFHPPTITLARPGSQAASESFTLKGEAKDDQKIRDVYIFVGDEKAFYEANPQASPRLPFETALTLKEGNNLVLITARDNNNLTATRRQVIRFEPQAIQKGAL